jgi:hypothetical protein
VNRTTPPLRSLKRESCAPWEEQRAAAFKLGGTLAVGILADEGESRRVRRNEHRQTSSRSREVNRDLECYKRNRWELLALRFLEFLRCILCRHR